MSARLTNTTTITIDNPAIDVTDVCFMVDKSDTTHHADGSSARISVGGLQYELTKVIKASGNTARSDEDNDWKLVENGGNLEIQKRESGVWNVKSTITA